MKPGTRLKSTVCDAEVMVIKAGSSGRIECGGQPMVEDRPADKAAADPAFTSGTLMGKRYTDSEGVVELLCVKPGLGSLSVEGVPLRAKDAKPLPSSD